MNLPVNVLLSKIVPQSLYLDKKSKESSTGKIKRKYKLAGNTILENYFFNILTRTYSACKASFTICLEFDDWENRQHEPRFWGQPTYCDLTKFEILSKAELIVKIRDKDNGFPFIAKLCEHKFHQIQSLRDKIPSCAYISSETKNLIQKGISPMINKALLKLGLN